MLTKIFKRVHEWFYEEKVVGVLTTMDSIKSRFGDQKDPQSTECAWIQCSATATVVVRNIPLKFPLMLNSILKYATAFNDVRP